MEITTIGPFLDYFERIRERTRRAVLLIPAEHLEWTWQAGKFTLGDLVRHIAATERFMFAENVQNKPSRYPGHGPDLAAGLPAVLEYFESMHREAVEIFSALSDDDLRSKCTTPAGTPIATWKWLRAMIEHEIHHRAQIMTALAMLGITTPPLYGLTSEQVRERSVE